MMIDKFRPGLAGRSTRSLRKVAVAAAMIPVLALTACSIDDILEVDDPDVILPETVQDPATLSSVHAAAIAEFIKSPDFEIAAFKGVPLTLRDWNLQLRQPILLADGRTVVSVSPQEGFLHQTSELDTLGYDRPETACRL